MRPVSPTQSLPTVSTSGKAFVTSSKSQQTRFIVRGVALASGFQVAGVTADLLADANYDYVKTAVLPGLKALNVNLVRVYQVDLAHQHDKVMNLLADNGIYVMVGVVTPDISVNRVNPTYPVTLYQRGTSVVDAFQKYLNTFGFSVGNEVVFPGTIYAYFYHQQYPTGTYPNPPQTNPPTPNAALTLAVAAELACAQVMKSFIRDLKAYMVAQSYRAIPVGMAMQDGPQASVVIPGLIGTDVVAAYYASGDAATRADFIGINSYRYVNTTGTPGPMSAYDGLATEVAGLPIPVFLTESGGNPSSPPPAAPYCRDWAIVPQMYSEALLYNNLSGQIAFQFFEEGAYFGLYNQPTTAVAPTATTWGGATNLATEFGACVSTAVPMPPAPVPPTSTAPANCSPALLPSFITVTVQNYATAVLDVVQGGSVIAQLPVGSSETPSSTQVVVSPAAQLFIQTPKTWQAVCNVSAPLTAGSVISNNLPWGNVACNVS